ncbi:site-specific DNA-methyltransferase [Gilliamella sp. ESL0232]|uniref:site-specific DNA-methyltransferase n=1 Tax=Gilliamella sp. ESL0232 TaxID=2705037 RepID=UPI00157FFA48|nr:site-specific DNA-methyltransferase [Gilliamella sp. ESL0232]
MDKLKMHSLNKVDENIKKIGAQFPNCITERKNQQGEVEYAIDFDLLKQELSSVIVEGREERYQFTWPDKKKSILLANAPIAKTLRPCREESVDFDDTENLYIEGDNLEVLKLLQETYLGKVKMIYIDPPYNTGNDFVYEDDFTQNSSEYLENSGQFDDEGNRLVKNTETNGRFHTDWLNMIYPRLKLARDLLTDDGVIFISIDDNEQENLKMCCNEIFGEDNFVNQFVWLRNSSGKTEIDKFTINTEYVLLYTKTRNFLLNSAYKPLADSSRKMYNKDDNDGRGLYQTVSLQKPRDPGPETSFDYIDNSGRVWLCPPKGWRMVYDKIKALENDNRLVFGGKSLRVKDYWNERENEGKRIDTLWNDLAENNVGSKELGTSIGIRGLFDNPKPTSLVNRCLQIGTNNNDIILDFFSGSATTAHAIMQLNAEDGGNRKFIMVQLPETTDEKSEAYKAGYKNICEIGKERIRRAGNKIAQENPQAKFDKGFRVLKCDSSNMKEVYYNPAEYNTDLLDVLIDNIKADRTAEDLLFQVMLDLGVLLSSDIKQTSIAGKTVFNVADNFLMACFDTDINEEVITAIAKQKPYYFVMRDSSMENDSVATNFEQIFTTYSPETKRKVL